MANNNLRVIYNNLADTSTITSSVASLGATLLANVKLNTKSLVNRTTGNSVTYTITLAASSQISGVILPFCNLTSTATITVALNTGLNTGAVLACPWQSSATTYGTIPTGANGYAYGRGTYARVWFTPTTCASLTVTITDTSNTDGYIELSRIVVGNYWSPTYNTEFGLSYTPKDTTTVERTEAGDSITNRGIRYGSINFNMNWLTPTDRTNLTNILKGGGIHNPVLVSLFPDNSVDWGKEGLFMLYGRFTQLGGISHPMYSMYSTTFDIEEI